jgi:phenylpropionate dioxygenase-like ring-hydroxylating dioxygenase large terminal subunit
MDDISQTGARMRVDQPLISGPYVRNHWYVAGWAEELAQGAMLARTIMDIPVVLFRKQDGSVAAIVDRCVHRFAPLSMGKLLPGDRIMCPYHGLEYDATGMCVHNPHGDKRVPSSAKLPSYTVVEKHMALWIWMGDKPADPAMIPDFSVLDNPPDIALTKRDQMMMASNYQLMIDNLLDLSHTCYLHDGLLGNADVVESDIQVDQDGDDVVVSRYAPNSIPPGMFAQFWPGHPERIEKQTHIRWMAPSTLKLMTGICENGDKLENGTGYHAIHMLTPETSHTTHYFFTAVRFGLKTNDESFNRDMQEKIAKMRRFAFEEQDAPVVAAQQVRIEGALEELKPVILPIDVGPVRYKRVLQKLLDAER